MRSLLLLIFLGSLLAGCIGFDESGSYPSGVPAPEPAVDTFGVDNAVSRPVYEDEQAGGLSLPGATGMVEKESSKIGSDDQKIIRSADLTLEVVNVSHAAQEIAAISSLHDGRIQQSSVQAGKNSRYSGVITVRVPGTQFTTVLTGIRDLGMVIREDISAEDVTEEYIDLSARKNAYSNQIAHNTRLFEKAVNVSEILEIQKEIDRVQVELDRVTGRMKYLDSRVDYSTITIRLSEPEQLEGPTGHSAAGVLSSGFQGLVETLVWMVITILTLLPLIILVAILYVMYRRWSRKTGP